jgi:alpha-tubulin suppressor-like RCC1 family protein
LYGWGYNSWGQLGDGTTINRITPVAVDTSGALSGRTVTAIAEGSQHTVALTSDGKLFAWGNGYLGNGTTNSSTTPVAVDMSGALLRKTVIAIASGSCHTLVLTSDGKVFAWGCNSSGQLGNGMTNSSTTPVAVDMSGALLGKTVTAIAAGHAHTVAVTSNGKVFAWGSNGWGQLGDSTTTHRTTPVAVHMSGALLGKTVTAIAGGGDHTVALTSDGKVFAWGEKLTHGCADLATNCAVLAISARRDDG